MEKKSKVEKISGSLLTSVAATAMTLLGNAATPLVAFLPALAAAPAVMRQQKRIAETLDELNEAFLRHEAQLRELSDAQYQFTSETLNTVLHTVDQRKLQYLKTAVKNGVLTYNMSLEDATQLSRLLRDITADEAGFLLENISKKTIYIDFDKNIGFHEMCIKRGSKEHKLFTGLCTLGLAEFSQKHFGVDAYFFCRYGPCVCSVTHRITSHLIVLIKHMQATLPTFHYLSMLVCIH